ncbi:MAG: conjugal transfer protein TraF [Marinagarivorans sp.]|nr:conjugal transfer protein TraF [Marinagarivorans sp.]
MKKILPALLAILYQPALAGSFSVYDARSQAMGGASVAVGSTAMAMGHNPALLGLGDEDEDDSKNGRYSLPYVAGNLSQAALDALNILDDELDVNFDNALDNFNTHEDPSQTIAIATAARDAGQALEKELIDVANEEINFNVFVGLISVSEPAEQGGGGFYLGSRIIGGGRSYIPDADITLYHDYVEALDNIAQGGDWRANAELFDYEEPYNESVPPSFKDLDTTSRADIRGLIINEAAVSTAWGFELDAMRVAIGATPKAMYVRVFDESREISSDELEIGSNIQSHRMFNVDLGVAIELENGVRIGYTAKDVISRTFTTDKNQTVRLETKHRIGAAYIRPQWQIGADLDMQEQHAFATERTGQYLALGGEYNLLNYIDLRAGYQYDTLGEHPGVISAGLGVRLGNTLIDASYRTSSEEKGAALQLSFAL